MPVRAGACPGAPGTRHGVSGSESDSAGAGGSVSVRASVSVSGSVSVAITDLAGAVNQMTGVLLKKRVSNR